MRMTMDHRVSASAGRSGSKASERVRAVASMFGLGHDATREVTIIPRTDMDLPIPGPGVTIITGPSGSGKSTLLRLIAGQCESCGVRTMTLHNDPAADEHDDECQRIDPDACVIDRIAPHQPLSKALELCGLTGLGDAFVLLRRPEHLSGGQRFRFRLARLLSAARGDVTSPDGTSSGKPTAPVIQTCLSENTSHAPGDESAESECQPKPQVIANGSAGDPVGNTSADFNVDNAGVAIFIDEFAATLDRITAQTLARNIRRWSDRTGVAFVLATTHDDVIDALQPDVVICKPLGNAIEVRHRPRNARRSTPSDANDPDQLRVEPGTLDDYRALAAFHYRSRHPGGATSVLRIVSRMAGPFCDPIVAGVLVRSLPALACRLRDLATGDRYAGLRQHERGVALNREIRCISRVIVDPRFRGLGLAVKLVRHALEHPEHPHCIYTEALAAMGRVSPFFQRAGMTRFDMPIECRAAHARLLDALESLGVQAHDLIDGIAAIADSDRSMLLREVRRFLQAARRMSREELAAMPESRLLGIAHERLMLQPAYFIFRHADMPHDSVLKSEDFAR